MTYKVHLFDLKMTADPRYLEQFLNSLKGEIVAIIPNISIYIFWAHRVDFVLVVEKQLEATS